jgi:hypothetical protein
MSLGGLELKTLRDLNLCLLLSIWNMIADSRYDLTLSIFSVRPLHCLPFEELLTKLCLAVGYC